jgi:hypothetical protein
MVAARWARSNGILFTASGPLCRRTLALASIHPVTPLSAGPPLGGLYLKPPSSGGLCDGVMTMPSARAAYVLSLAVITYSLTDGQDMTLVERICKGRAPMPRGAECDPLLLH